MTSNTGNQELTVKDVQEEGASEKYGLLFSLKQSLRKLLGNRPSDSGKKGEGTGFLGAVFGDIAQRTRNGILVREKRSFRGKLFLCTILVVIIYAAVNWVAINPLTNAPGSVPALHAAFSQWWSEFFGQWYGYLRVDDFIKYVPLVFMAVYVWPVLRKLWIAEETREEANTGIDDSAEKAGLLKRIRGGVLVCLFFVLVYSAGFLFAINIVGFIYIGVLGLILGVIILLSCIRIAQLTSKKTGLWLIIICFLVVAFISWRVGYQIGSEYKPPQQSQSTDTKSQSTATANVGDTVALFPDNASEVTQPDKDIESNAGTGVKYIPRLTDLKRKANEEFAVGDMEEAKKTAQEVMALNPTDAQMIALQKRIAVFPQVQELLAQARVARAENRPAKEAAALQKALALDRSHTAAQTRLAELHGQLKRQRFLDAVQNARAVLDAGDWDAAAKQIALAKTLFPTDKTLPPLEKQLRQAQLEKEFAAQINHGEQAKARDDWSAAVTHFQRARKLKPDDKTAVENHDLAQRIVGVEQQLRLLSDREHRLGDKNVLASASAYLQEAESLVEISPGLKKIHAELTRKVALYRAEVEVVVVSDNATYIVVRGEGQVGETARRTIRLRPGERVFEGTRSGYKSKLVTVDLVPGASAVEVVVICDEKI